MPYITQEKREQLDDWIASAPPMDAGQLAYALYVLLGRRMYDPLSYTRASEVFGVIETVKLELYRKVLSPYEDEKCDENGEAL